MKTLLVFLHGIGDCLMFTPAVRMYARAHPQEKLGILCLPLTKELWKANPHLNEVFTFSRTVPLHHGWLPRYIIERMALQKEINEIVRAHDYDRVEYVVPHSIRIFGITIPLPGLLRRLLTLPFESHEVLKLCKRLGVGQGLKWPQDFKQDLRLPKRFEPHARKMLGGAISRSSKHPLCILHTQASSLNKSLTEGEKRDIISLLKKKFDLIILQEHSPDPACGSVITKEVLTSAAIIKAAKLFVGIDSGPAHIAEVLGIPRIIIAKAFPPEKLFVQDRACCLLREVDPSKIEGFLEKRKFQ